jgi:hypothetical protein
MASSKIGRYFNPGTTMIMGFVLGAGLILFLLYIPQQQLLHEREKSINEMARFNREEQERVRAMRDVSSGEMLKWIGMTERTNAEFQAIQQRLAQRELQLAGHGSYYITLTAILIGGLFAFYIWAKRTTDIKDVATLENFQTFITVQMRMLEDEKAVARKLAGLSQAPRLINATGVRSKPDDDG